MSPHPPSVSVREFVQGWCAANNLSMAALAARLPMSRSTFYKALRDPQSSPEAVRELADHVGVDARWLASLGGSEGRRSEVAPSLLSEIIDRVANERGMTRDALISSLPVSRSTFYELLRGSTPTPRTAVALADGLGVDLREVLEASGRESDEVAAALARNCSDRLLAERVRFARKRTAVRTSTLVRAGRDLGDPSLVDQLGPERLPVCNTSSRLGQRLDVRAYAEGWTQARLAKTLGVTYQYLSGVLNGLISGPSEDFLTKVSHELSCSLDDVRAMVSEIRPRWEDEGRALREARQAAGLTGSQLAAACGVAASTVYMWENGRSRPSAARRTLINRTLRYDYDRPGRAVRL